MGNVMLDTAGWTVHDQHAGVLSYSYTFNDKGGTATTFAARITDGGLMVISPAQGIDEAAFKYLEQFGEPRVIIAPNGFHHLGLVDWRRRYRHATFHAPKRAAKRIAKKNERAPKLENLQMIGEQLGGQVYLREAPHSRHGELWSWVKTPTGNIWFGSGFFCNWEKFPGNAVLNAAWKLTNSGPGLSIFNLGLMATMSNKKAALNILLNDMIDHPPSILVPSHGAPVIGGRVETEVTRLLRRSL